MSAFQQLPREIRDLIYEYCLLYDEEIVPFPSHAEKAEVLKRSRIRNNIHLSKGEPTQTGGTGVLDVLLGYPNIYPYVKRDALQAQNKPCVALLGVNSTIRDEAASILFGKNVWRLSLTFDRVDRCRWWETYAKYFHHVVARFDASHHDSAELLDIDMEEMDCVVEDSDHFDQTGTPNIHQKQLNLLKHGFLVKRRLLQRMNLKTLVLDFSELYCPHWCCSREALQSCLETLDWTRLWVELEQERGSDIETKVRVRGLNHNGEERLVRETWGLKVG